MIQNKMGVIFPCLCLLVSVLSVPGCNKNTAIKTDVVTGTVTMGGSPLAGATVSFLPVDTNGSTAVGTTDDSGKYTLQTLLGAADAGTTPGDYVVTVSKMVNEPTGRQEWSESDGKMLDIMVGKETVPAKFATKRSTPLKATVISGQANRFDFDVSN
jgi:hypothetical protein